MKKRRANPASDLETIIPLLIGAWRKLQREKGPADRLQTREFRCAVSALLALHHGLFVSNDLLGSDWIADQNYFGAYLLYDWIIHYQEALSLLGELPRAPSRVLDIGSGAAPFALAALKHGACDVTATDRNIAALRYGACLAGQCGFPLAIRQWDCLSAPLPVEGKFDLIIIGHCLEEMFPMRHDSWLQQRSLFVQGMLERLTADGFLLVVDSSHSDVNRRQLMLRDALVALGVPIQAPCLGKIGCPALASATPCYAQREMEKPFIIKEFQRAAKINLSSLKMSYTLYRSAAACWPHWGEEPLFRVISPPVEAFRGKRFYLCGAEGKKSLGSHIVEQEKDTRAFEFLRRGDVVTVKNALDYRGQLDLVSGSKLTVFAASGKPLPSSEQEEDTKW